jgi:Uma2 family endonuclease
MSVGQLVTAEELWAMPEVPGAGGKHGQLALWLGALLLRFVGERDVGVVSGDGTGYLLYRRPDGLRIPDVSSVAKERLPEDGVPEGFWPFAPDLAVEIVSPNDHGGEVRAKAREYLAAGTRLVWVLWPRRQAIGVYPASDDLREHGLDDELDGGIVLPGFRVRVTDLFAVAR